MIAQKYKSEFVAEEIERALDTSYNLSYEDAGLKEDAADVELYFRSYTVSDDATPVHTKSWERVEIPLPDVVPVLQNSDDSILADSEGNVLIPN